MDALISKLFKSQGSATAVMLWVIIFFQACILAPDFITVSTNTVVALVGLASAAGGLKFILPDAPPPPAPPAPPDGLGGRGA
jgi:hypothetical protein